MTGSGQADGGWVPAFTGQRPPLAPNNTLAVTHGARSPRVVEPIAQALKAEVVEAAPYPGNPR